MNPAIYFSPDGYVMDGPKLMGRHSAGNGFLRAAVRYREDGPVNGLVRTQAHGAAFKAMVAGMDPSAQTTLIASNDLESCARIGLYYWPDVNLGPRAWQRLRVGPAAFSLCGVTHTISTSTALSMLASHPFTPLMAWDAVICTSTAAVEVVTGVYAEAEAQHRWRTRSAEPLPRPLTPLIPLGVHTGDYDFAPESRPAARAAIGLADDEIAVLAPGRISLSGKAHPYPLMAAAQAVAVQTGARLSVVFAGQAAASALPDLYRDGAAAICPDVRVLFVDGKDPARYSQAWAAADIFVSLADSIQETFGLTPIEAMAAGLPALVSDWDGYKDTVRDGIDGFRVPTWAQSPGTGQKIARDYETDTIDSNEYHSRANSGVAVDMAVLRERLAALVTDADLRRRMGASGRARARETYDWKLVYGRYRELWAELAAIRAHAAADPQTRAWLDAAPRSGAAHMGPFDTFSGFPTRHVTAQTLVAPGGVDSPEAYHALMTLGLMDRWRIVDVVFDRVREALADGPLTVEALAGRLGFELRLMIEVVARLAKYDAVSLA